ncbi:hypothetical protein KBB05_00415 [Patescibacteria group bacterium]|nr:hypothetical protein [Patescibacteria group bacterium]
MGVIITIGGSVYDGEVQTDLHQSPRRYEYQEDEKKHTPKALISIQ